MAHFAKINENNIVETVVVVNNDVIVDENGNESEAIGNEFLNSIGMTGTWVQCSYNASFRGMYPHPGAWFDAANDRFLPSASPFPSWVFDELTMGWNAPIARPNDNGDYFWNEKAQNWEPVEKAS